MKVCFAGLVLIVGVALAGCSSSMVAAQAFSPGVSSAAASSASADSATPSVQPSSRPVTACTMVEDSVRDADIAVEGYAAMTEQAEDVEKALDLDVAAIRTQATAAGGIKGAAMRKVAADVAALRGAVTVNLDLQAPLETLSADLDSFDRACFGPPRPASASPSP